MTLVNVLIFVGYSMFWLWVGLRLEKKRGLLTKINEAQRNLKSKIFKNTKKGGKL